MNDVKVVRGAEIGSDHHLVLIKVRLHRRVHTRKVEEHSRLSTERLATKEGKMAYRIRLRLKLNGAKWVNGSNVERRGKSSGARLWRQQKMRVGKRSAEMTSRELDGGIRR